MRMWMVNPKMLCRKHLLGEHVELHMFVGTILSNKSLSGYLSRGLVEPQNIVNRHQELVKEMINRGYHHKSELPEFTYNQSGIVNPDKNLLELSWRCPDCCDRIINK